jgi:hypothetical protein
MTKMATPTTKKIPARTMPIMAPAGSELRRVVEAPDTGSADVLLLLVPPPAEAAVDGADSDSEVPVLVEVEATGWSLEGE